MGWRAPGQEVDQGGRGPGRTWTEVVQKDCRACNLNREDAVGHGTWKKLIKIG